MPLSSYCAPKLLWISIYDRVCFACPLILCPLFWKYGVIGVYLNRGKLPLVLFCVQTLREWMCVVGGSMEAIGVPSGATGATKHLVPHNPSPSKASRPVGTGQHLHAWNATVRNKAGSCSSGDGGPECTPSSILRFLQMRGLWEAIVNFSCVLLQGKSLSNVNLMAVTGSLPIAVIERNTPMSIPATSPTTVRFEAVTNPILTQALWGNTWRFTASLPHLLQEPLVTHQWGLRWVTLCPLCWTQPGVDPALCPLRWPTSVSGTFARPVGPPVTSTHLPAMEPPLSLKTRKCTGTLKLCGRYIRMIINKWCSKWGSLDHILTWDNAEPETNWWLRLATGSN